MMKTKLALFVTVLAAALFAGGCASTESAGNQKTAKPEEPKEPAFVKEGLVAYYPFNGNAKNENDNANHGKVTGAGPSKDRLGKPSAAYNFDGKSDYLEIPHTDAVSFGQENFAISIWLRVPAQSGGGVFMKFDPKKKYRDFGGVTIFAEKQVDQKQIQFRLSKTERLRYVLPDDAKEHNDWSHYIFQKTGKNISIYLDSKLVASREVNVLNTYKNDAPIVIGANCSNLRSQNLIGEIDDVRIYNRALSATEVKALYDLEKPKGK